MIFLSLRVVRDVLWRWDDAGSRRSWKSGGHQYSQSEQPLNDLGRSEAVICTTKVQVGARRMPLSLQGR